MKKIFLFFHTVKYLRWTQVYFRIYRKLVRPKVIRYSIRYLPERNKKWVNQILYEEKITSQNEATFLNYTRQLTLPDDWNNDLYPKLWLYNLHYFEDLISDKADRKYHFHLNLLDSWITQNPYGLGNGWEPYPISLRISNILKAWLAGLPLKTKHFESLYEQSVFLSGRLEKHLLGNHYFANLKAILFAGVIFDNKYWLDLAIKGLLQEIPEQILEDGGNFELTPMYHSLILVDMLDIYNIALAYPDKINRSFVFFVRNNIKRMLFYMNVMAHNNGCVSFFNDSVDGIAPKKNKIESYAKALGFDTPKFDYNKIQVFDLYKSGYIVATHSGNKLIFDAASVGPDYIPGHAHADTLSFELSIGNERVFVNTGISQYELGAKRLDERKTFAHNTVEVDGVDSSQVWSSFRVAKRARVIERNSYIEDGKVILCATHNGYKKIIRGPLHRRELIFSANSLAINDKLKGKFSSAIAYFYFHPKLDIKIQENKITICGQYFSMQADLQGKKVELSDSTWHPGFGLSEANKCLKIYFSGNDSNIEFSWSVLE